MRGPFRSQVAFWSEPIRAEPLALFRILVGLVAIGAFCSSMLPLLDRYLDQQSGLTPSQAMGNWLNRTWRFSMLCGPDGIPGLADALGPDRVAAWKEWGNTRAARTQLACVLVVSLICVSLGLLTRLSLFVAWVLFLSFNNRLYWYTNGGDGLVGTSLFYLMISPAGATWSVDAWLFGRKQHPVTIPPWSVRLMQIQLGLVYFFTGLAKLGPDWLNGEATYWVMNDLAISRWPYCWMPIPLLLCRVMSWVTLIFEIGFPLFVIFQRTRRLILLVGLAFHVGIWLSMEVGWFSQITVCWYVLFLTPEEIKALLTRARRLLGFGRESPRVDQPPAELAIQ